MPMHFGDPARTFIDYDCEMIAIGGTELSATIFAPVRRSTVVCQHLTTRSHLDHHGAEEEGEGQEDQGQLKRR